VANGAKLGLKPKLTAHHKREAIKRRDAGEATRHRAQLQRQPQPDFKAFRMSAVHLARILASAY
jgi:hypothetical protein